jgi:hypothetical protein
VGTASPPSQHSLSRRSFLRLGAASLAGFGLYTGEISRHELSIENVTIHLTRLPDAFRGMRIVQISDFHYAEFTEAYFVREVVRRVNQLRPDMVLLTGDFISYGPLPYSFARLHAKDIAAILSGLTCPLRYAIMGNHDCIVGAKYVAGPLREAGIAVLENRYTALERDGQRLWLAGLGSVSLDDSKPHEGIPPASLTGKEPVIVLSHEPDILPQIARYNADLMLSGHTHGGQIRFPFLPPLQLPDYGKIYVQGLFRHGPTQLYVNRGIGAVGIPFRFRCPPEITVLTLA